MKLEKESEEKLSKLKLAQRASIKKSLKQELTAVNIF